MLYSAVYLAACSFCCIPLYNTVTQSRACPRAIQQHTAIQQLYSYAAVCSNTTLYSIQHSSPPLSVELVLGCTVSTNGVAVVEDLSFPSATLSENLHLVRYPSANAPPVTSHHEPWYHLSLHLELAIQTLTQRSGSPFMVCTSSVK